MTEHNNISNAGLRKHIKEKIILFGGNKQLKICGTLQCKSGKRMKKSNRVFFSSKQEAFSNGYRPCGHCMKQAYQKWKNGLIW